MIKMEWATAMSAFSSSARFSRNRPAEDIQAELGPLGLPLLQPAAGLENYALAAVLGGGDAALS